MDTYRHVEGEAIARLSPAPSKAAGETVYNLGNSYPAGLVWLARIHFTI